MKIKNIPPNLSQITSNSEQIDSKERPEPTIFLTCISSETNDCYIRNDFREEVLNGFQ